MSATQSRTGEGGEALVESDEASDRYSIGRATRQGEHALDACADQRSELGLAG